MNQDSVFPTIGEFDLDQCRHVPVWACLKRDQEHPGRGRTATPLEAKLNWTSFMALRKLDKTEWRVFCDRVSKALVGKRAEIEVASLALGSQVEAKWLPLLGIAYDLKDDIIEIALEGLDHMVHRPREMYVDLGPDGLTNLEVIDGDDVRHIVKFRDPLMLPPPSSALQKDSSGEQGQP